MRKVSSVILKAIAGFFFYLVCLLGFIHGPETIEKAVILLVFLVPAIAALCGGLGLSGFSRWKKDTGIVLLCAAGFTAFLVFTIACYFMTPQFRQMMPPCKLAFFSSYITGGTMIFGFAALGGILVKADKNTSTHTTTPDHR